MSNENKTLRISAYADEQSFRAIGSFIDDLNRRATQAAEAINRVVGAAAGHGPVSVGGTPGGQAPGPGFARAQAASAASQNGGIQALLQRGLGGAGDVLKGV